MPVYYIFLVLSLPRLCFCLCSTTTVLTYILETMKELGLGFSYPSTDCPAEEEEIKLMI